MSLIKVETEISGRTISLESGLMAQEADGAVVVRLGDTMVLSTATQSATVRKDVDFFPLLVEFEEKLYAAGKIPGGFFKREGRPSEKAILSARLVDRSLRPLFPEGFFNDVQIVVTSLSADQENLPDILGVIGASAALTISDIPFFGPIGAVRVGYIKDNFIINPTYTELTQSSLDLIIAGADSGEILMLEVGAFEVSEDLIVEAIKAASEPIKKIIELQKKLAVLINKPKRTFEPYQIFPEISSLVEEKFGSKISQAMHVLEKEKQKEALELIEKELNNFINLNQDESLKKLLEQHPNDIKLALKSIQKKVVRESILNQGKRPDGRGLLEIRPVSAQTAILPRVHGSGLFARGGTQVLTVATLGTGADEQIIDGLGLEESKRYMHHYNFPAYSVGEVKPLRGPGRREIGHGALAERALLPVIPSEIEFPYTIRLVSEVLGSNGSTSMASTCGSTLALMDAGVPIKEPVSGISIGLVKEGEKYCLLTDIQGLEDFFGDMDFKITATKNGLTAIQLDVKSKELTLPIIKEALDRAREANNFIMEKLLLVISGPRSELSPYAPRVTIIQIDPSQIGELIGPGGKVIKKIVEESGAKIDIEDDGRVLVYANDGKSQEEAVKRINEITLVVKVGDVFTGAVTRILNFGAFVEITPGKEGLVHISQIADRRINRVEDVLKIGDEVKVKVVEIDELGRFNLSMKGL